MGEERSEGGGRRERSGGGSEWLEEAGGEERWLVVVVVFLCVDRHAPGELQSVHQIMGAVSLWTRLPALYLCTIPQKVYPLNQLHHRTTVRSRLSPERRHQENSPICTSGTSTIRRVLHLRISMVCQTGETMETSSASRQRSEPARPAQQGHQSPCTATAKSLWSSNKAGPWRAVKAARKGNRRPARNCNCGITTV